MVDQIVPQWKINQIFQLAPEATIRNLRALIVGPAYRVLEDAAGGAYRGQSIDVQWPDRQAGEVVDESYTSVMFKSAALRYTLVAPGSDIQTVTGVANRLRQDSGSGFNWRANGAFLRAGVIPFDPEIGDWVRVSNGPVEFVTSIVGFDGDADPTTPATGPAASGGSNFSTQAAADTLTPVGVTSAVTLAEDASGYEGQQTRAMVETYTIEVVVGSESGNAGEVRLRVTSASGTDPEQIIEGISFATAYPIGGRGAQITFTSSGTVANDFVTGDTWTWEITQGYTEPTATSGGTYSGEEDTTYIVSVVRGGDWTAGSPALRPIIEVTTTDASDVGVPTEVTASSVPVGTRGINITFSAGNGLLVAGDQWTVLATAEALGDVNQLVLANSLPVGLQGVPLQVELAIVEDVEITGPRFQSPPLFNWTTDSDEISFTGGIQAEPASPRTSSLLDVASADVVITYRSLRTAIANQVWDIADESVAQSTLGADTPDAVLAYGTRRALAGAGGQVVKVLPIETDDTAGYQKALSILKERDDFYRIVPLTHDTEVQAAVVSEVNRRSGAAVGRWATTMLGLPLVTNRQIVGSEAQGSQHLGTITDPTGGSSYTRLFDESGDFISRGVRPGDIVRAKYASDGFGGQDYETFVVDTVVSNEEINLLNGPSTPAGVPALYEIWRNLSITEQAEDYASRAASFGNRRVTVIFPANPGRGGIRVPNYFLACTAAAYRCAAVPHQGLTNAELPDWDDLEESSVTFADQLDTLANGGVYIVTQDPGGRVFIRKQLTTDLADTKRAEDSATVNVDSISYYFLGLLSRYIGRANVVPSATRLIENRINQGISFLVSDTFIEELGGQLSDGEIIFIRPHATLLDRLVVRVRGDIPIPLNNGDMDLVV